MWVMILEKAWAKLHGYYLRTESGSSYDTFRDLTGAPSFKINFENEENKDVLWRKILSWS